MTEADRLACEAICLIATPFEDEGRRRPCEASGDHGDRARCPGTAIGGYAIGARTVYLCDDHRSPIGLFGVIGDQDLPADQ